MNEQLRRQTAREAGICMDCPAPVDGKRGFAIRCATCRREAGRAAGARHYAASPKRRATVAASTRKIRADRRSA